MDEQLSKSIDTKREERISSSSKKKNEQSISASKANQRITTKKQKRKPS
jgi:hypothetical protein